MVLQEYMSAGIRDFMAQAYRNVLSNPREARFAFKMQRLFEKSEKRRREVAKREGVDIPPFLISSISTVCNLNCKGCYARKNGIAGNPDAPTKATLKPDDWRQVFTEAASLGVNFSLLAGGEPLMRRDLLEAISSVQDMIFPVFTNGTLIGQSYLDFFDSHLNMVPIISIEGMQDSTDDRRGQGVFRRAREAMRLLSGRDLIYGVSITVTTENMDTVTSTVFLDEIKQYGCRLVFYVEYVPMDEGTQHLAFGDEHVERMERLMEERRRQYDGIIFFSFPGDEKATGGCVASGRGFFHIGPDGSAEPCPFSPYSDSNVMQTGVLGALKSPLFRRLRDASAMSWGHTGGCTLYEHREEVEAMVKDNQQ